MACLIRLPGDDGPGVVTVTTQERDNVVRKDAAVAATLARMKPRWMVGLHHNWHDFAFHYDPLFDFSLAGEEDLIEASGKPFPLIPLDACNFVPEYFKPGIPEGKFWDVLYVARAVFFKRIPEFLACMRALYDRGQRLRVLFICPVPPGAGQNKDDTVLDVRKLYESMFTEEEQDLFTLLALDFRYPFPLDLETIAFFYRSSHVFVHFASDERRCRVAAYAWACGLPVVAMEPVGSLLPARLRRPPYFFQADSFEAFPELILTALGASAKGSDVALRPLFVENETTKALDHDLAGQARLRGRPYKEGRLAATSLGIRLGRHHIGPSSTNTLGQPLSEFLDFIDQSPIEALGRHFSRPDPERSIAAEAARSPAQSPSLWGRLRRTLGKQSY